MLSYLFMSPGHVFQCRVGNDTFYIVAASNHVVRLGDDSPFDFPDSSNKNDGDSAGSSFTTNKEMFVRLSQKREKLAYMVAHEVFVKEIRPKMGRSGEDH